MHFGEYEDGKSFGAYWVKKGHLVGSFLEGGTKEEYETISKATQLKPAVTIDLEELEREGLGFAHTVVSQQKVPEVKDIPSAEMVKQSASVVMIKKPLYVWHAATGVVVAASVAAFAFWYGRRRRRW